MKDKYFIDTNILVYANDRSDTEKHEKAGQLILKGMAQGNSAVSTQILSEFYVTVTRKIKNPLPAHVAKKEILLFKNMEVVDVDFHCVIQAINISAGHHISFWDALVIAAAQKAKCNVLYSEDLNPGQKIGSLIIINPF